MTKPMDLRRVPQADWVDVFLCDNPKCQRAHVVLFNEQDEAIAHFVLPDPPPAHTGRKSFLQRLTEANYHSIMMRD